MLEKIEDFGVDLSTNFESICEHRPSKFADKVAKNGSLSGKWSFERNLMISFEDIKQKALELGFDDAGHTYPKVPEKDIAFYRDWLRQNKHGSLKYMENELRCFPEEFFPGAKSAVIFLSFYKQKPMPFQKDAGLIASYARGRDYHNVHRKRLKKMISWLEEMSGQKNIARGFSDSAPVLEKVLAVQAGLGWFGKNTLLINKKFGTFTLISGLLTSLEISNKKLEMSLPKCGSCTRCIDACPTQAIELPYHLNASKCLSYHLIESKEPMPDHIQRKNPGFVFGCDICQDVCPHNARKPESFAQEFQPEKGIGNYLTKEGVMEIQNHPEKLHGTPLNRRGAIGLKHNLDTLLP